MAKMKCKCGEILSNRLVPNDVELKVYTDKEWDMIYELDSIDEIPEPQYDVWRCNACERLHFFDGTKIIKTYVLET
ncbi:hypothetical protein [Paenibacillus eucommiae]|uniref:CxxH/CxxC protein n=1 Tax=Paenibacillus eucommiae TaxID=1355755 RepID=A0ABS4IMC1_9BACL|nr:hypothetical protein [Paenibacillus eucommiae]MBP1988713.1 hypothetical protein [Paenibacillus eucommiae]